MYLQMENSQKCIFGENSEASLWTISENDEKKANKYTSNATNHEIEFGLFRNYKQVVFTAPWS